MNNTFFSLALTLLLLAGSLLPTVPSRADDVTAGRDIAIKWQDAVVTVKIAAKVHMSFEGEEHVEDYQREAIGTVIDPTGLVVVSLTNSDPTETFAKMMEDEDMKGMKITTEMTDCKVRFSDGVELPAKFLLRDKDLDLAFLKLTNAPEKPLTALDMTKPATLGLLDPIIVLGRMGPVANRTIAVALDRVEAIVEKPRKFYITNGSGNAPQLGSPAFGLDGNLAGIMLLRIPSTVKSSGDNSPIPIILTTADVAKAAKSATAPAGGK